MKCPQCAMELRDIEYEGVTIRTCDECGGEFIDPDEMGHIVTSREQRMPKEVQAALEGHRPQFGVCPTQTERVLHCPRCENPMLVCNYCGDSGVFVDRCEECDGMWLDHEELEKIQVVLEEWAEKAPEQIQAIAGKLEEARRQAAESHCQAFQGSRFAFVNAIINRFLDAA